MAGEVHSHIIETVPSQPSHEQGVRRFGIAAQGEEEGMVFVFVAF
jgi:hypothetical protein